MTEKELTKLYNRVLNLATTYSRKIHVPVRRDQLLWLIEQAAKNLPKPKDLH